jgi:creatinine amidohydrolase
MVYETIGSQPAAWAGKTAPEIREIAEQDGSVLVIPVGSIEQHGNHMPVATDTILVDAVAHRSAERVVDEIPILVSPPVWSGYSPHHMPFGGTITLEYDELLDVLEDIADSALDNGFDSLLLLNGHGGNASLVSSATSTIGTEQPQAEILALTYFQLAASFIDDIRDTTLGGMGHAGEFETSLMMHLRPELVDEDRMEGTNMDEPYSQGIDDLVAGGPLSVYREFTEYSETGAIGDPTVSSAEKGERILELLCDEMESLLAQMYERNR